MKIYSIYKVLGLYTNKNDAEWLCALLNKNKNPFHVDDLIFVEEFDIDKHPELRRGGLSTFGTSATPQPEHKSIEEIKDKCLKLTNGVVNDDFWGYVFGSLMDYGHENGGLMSHKAFMKAIEIVDYVTKTTPHLSNRNLLKRLKGLKMRSLDIDAKENSKSPNYVVGYNSAVKEINSKLDEFIESEGKLQ